MSDSLPDYELESTVVASTAEQVRVITHALRSQILDLVLERAATVSELAESLDTPRSSMAYHVDRLVDVGMLRVVRTRRVRAIDERFYGRSGRTIVIESDAFPGSSIRQSFLDQARAEVVPDTEFLATLRHARIPESRAEDFFAEVGRLAEEFTALPREGEVVYGFVAAVYPTALPSLKASGADAVATSEADR